MWLYGHPRGGWPQSEHGLELWRILVLVLDWRSEAAMGGLGHICF